MSNGICYIIGAGEDYGLDFCPKADDYVIAADGGFAYLQQAGIDADMVIGDFDTLQQKPSHPNIITLDTQKDETDTFAAIQQGISRGYRVFHLYCCTGGRIEHTLANIQLLAYLSERTMHGFLFDQSSIMTAITNSKITLPEHDRNYISVFSHSDVSNGVFLSGLEYRLDNAVLTNVYPIGVSNEFIGSESVISVENGTLIVVYPRSIGGHIA